MRAQLFTEDAREETGAAVVQPWLEGHPLLPAPDAGACVVLAPDVVQLAAIKRSWLATGGRPLLGLSFWTPGELRRFLLAHLLPGQTTATAEDLALLTRLVAGDDASEDPRGVVARDPDGFLRAWDTLLAARGEDNLLGRPWHELRVELEKRLKQLGLASVRAIDWELAEVPPASSRPPLARLLTVGFSAVHSPLFPLLTAALRQTREATMVLPLPRERPIETLWLGTFEGLAGVSAEPAVAAMGMTVSERRFARCAEAAEVGGFVAKDGARPEFRLFSERRFEVAAVVEQVRSVLSAEADVSLGVVLPNEAFLVRAVADALVAEGFPVHDTFGYFPVAEPVETVLATWVAWQRSGQLVEAQAFLEALEAAGMLAPEVADALLETWREARERTGSDDFAVLTAYLAGDGHLRGAAEAARWAAKWPRLDAEGTLSHFLEISRATFEQWGQGGRLETARSQGGPLWREAQERVERSVFLDWLFNSLRVPGRARHPAARDAFSPVQLVSYEMVRSSSWNHLFLVGLNEGLAPARETESAYLVPDAAMRHLAHARREGASGEGDERLADGVGFLLDERNRRAIQAGLLFDAVGEVSTAVVCFATYAPEGDDRQATVLSEWFLRLFRASHGPEAALPRVEGELPASLVRPFQEGKLPSVAATRSAYARRADPATAFDAYSFGFREPPEAPLELGARDWEDYLQRPAAVWLKAVARVRPRADFREPLKEALVAGLATHRLLSLPHGTGNAGWHALDSIRDHWCSDLERMAYAWRQAVERAFAAATGDSLPPGWKENWGRILGDALELAEGVIEGCASGWLTSERRLPEASEVVLPSGAVLRLRGRVDALWADDPLTPHRGLVFDYKTGRDNPLKTKDLQRGKGLQLLLYALAWARHWKRMVGSAVLKPGEIAAAQIEVEAGEDPSGLLEALAAIGQSGVFGFSGEVRSEYAYVGDYPMSFFPPPAEVVEQKWAHTHGPNSPLVEGGGE